MSVFPKAFFFPAVMYSFLILVSQVGREEKKSLGSLRVFYQLEKVVEHSKVFCTFYMLCQGCLKHHFCRLLNLEVWTTVQWIETCSWWESFVPKSFFAYLLKLVHWSFSDLLAQVENFFHMLLRYSWFLMCENFIWAWWQRCVLGIRFWWKSHFGSMTLDFRWND